MFNVSSNITQQAVNHQINITRRTILINKSIEIYKTMLVVLKKYVETNYNNAKGIF